MKVEKSNLDKIQEEIGQRELSLDFSNENIFWELHYMTEILTGEASWIQNIKITNKKEQRKAFKQARQKGEKWNPEFEFKETEKNFQTLKKNIDQCIEATEKISGEKMDDAGFKTLSPGEMKDFFRELFRELKLYTELAENVEDRESWENTSEEIWPMVSEEKYQASIEKIEELENKELDKDLDEEDVKKMFEEEIERLGFEYSVEIRDVGGCFNVPEEKTVVVAGDRKYSQREAEMLTKHEIFHVVRGINGRNASKEGFPPVLGIHTPFYDSTEEGGALYRERATDTNYESKDFDYHLRLIAAYKISQGEAFHDVVEDLIELGGSLERSFYLVARNREALRHHIYLDEMDVWGSDQDKLLIGKVNLEWSQKLWKEIEDEGVFRKPEIDSEVLF